MILAPVLLGLLGLVIAAGRATIAQGSVDAAARDAARQASISLTPAVAQGGGASQRAGGVTTGRTRLRTGRGGRHQSVRDPSGRTCDGDSDRELHSVAVQSGAAWPARQRAAAGELHQPARPIPIKVTRHAPVTQMSHLPRHDQCYA